jgi:hypothetical protein
MIEVEVEFLGAYTYLCMFSLSLFFGYYDWFRFCFLIGEGENGNINDHFTATII